MVLAISPSMFYVLFGWYASYFKRHKWEYKKIGQNVFMIKGFEYRDKS
jgi:hypothetical protein